MQETVLTVKALMEQHYTRDHAEEFIILTAQPDEWEKLGVNPQKIAPVIPPVKTERIGWTAKDRKAIRAWAAKHKIACPARGQIPAKVLKAYAERGDK